MEIEGNCFQGKEIIVFSWLIMKRNCMREFVLPNPPVKHRERRVAEHGSK